MSQTVRFGARENGGVMLGFRLPQWGLFAAALLCVVAGVNGAGPLRLAAERLSGFPAQVVGGLGHILWVVPVGLCIAVAIVPVKGRYLDQYVPVAWNLAWQKITGQDAFRGGIFRLAERGNALPQLELPGNLAHLVPLSYDVGGGEGGEIVVVKDPIERTYTAVLQCQGTTFALAGSVEKQTRIEKFGAALSRACSEGGIVKRIQILERTETDNGESLTRDFAVRGIHEDNGGDLTAARQGRQEEAEREGHRFAEAAYAQLISSVSQAQQTHETFVAVVVDGRKAASEIRLAGGGDEGAAAVMMREIESMAGSLREAGVDVLGWCPPRLLGFIIRTAFDPAQRSTIERRGGADSDARGGAEGLPSGVALAAAGPMAAENHWAYYSTDSAVHRTWWITEWPRKETAAGFLQPVLLESTCRRSVSLIFEPVPTSKARRKFAAKQANLEGEAGLRAWLRRRTSRREELEAMDVARKEDEHQAGHGVLRITGLLTTTASDLEELEQQSSEIELLAANSSLEVTRLVAEHDQGFAAGALPLGRGVRTKGN